MRSTSRTERSLDVVDPLPYIVPKGSLSRSATVIFDQGVNRLHTTKATLAIWHFRASSQHKEEVDDYHIRRIGPIGLAPPGGGRR
jgi:hypothetical protein